MEKLPKSAPLVGRHDPDFFFFYVFFFLLAGNGLNENCKDNELFVYIHTTLSFLFTCLKLYFHG